MNLILFMCVKMPEDKKLVRMFLISSKCKASGGIKQLLTLLMNGLRLLTDLSNDEAVLVRTLYCSHSRSLVKVFAYRVLRSW